MALLKGDSSDDLTLKYLLQNNKGGGGGGAKIHVGDDPPTDPDVNIWLDTDEQGASVVTSVNGHNGAVNLLNLVYPVGSIYMSVNSVSPASLFGGTWEQIEDTFLLACGSTYTNGDTGGEATHELSADEMPSHRHWISAGTYDDGNMSTTGKSNTQDNGLAADAGAYSENDTVKTYGRYSAWAGGTAGASGKGGGSTASATSAHNNMPPYLAVYMWKRTA